LFNIGQTALAVAILISLHLNHLKSYSLQNYYNT